MEKLMLEMEAKIVELQASLQSAQAENKRLKEEIAAHKKIARDCPDLC